MSKMCGVYSITNTENGKKYIGSSVNIHHRWRLHRWRLDRGEHHSPHLQSSWKKRGPKAFKFEVLLECDRDSLIKYEQEFIDRFNTTQNGYNICPVAGNCLGLSPSPETRAKLAKAWKGRKHTKASRRLMSLATRGVPKSYAHKAALRGPRGKLENIRLSKLGDKNPNFGKPRSEETKRKIAEAQRGIPRKGNCLRWNINRGKSCTCGKHL
jgi:group I intron endonuclease